MTIAVTRQQASTLPQDPADFCGFVGLSAPMQAVYRMIRNAAPSNASVFVTGESGTGKELAAQALHALSPRRNGPIVAINCSAIPRDLLESEIFGHVRGAFTGAVADRAGAAELADGGTLFLDEICDMDPALQAKLLRFLETGIVQRVGESRQRRVNVRFVCATNCDPHAAVRSGRFRADLFFRLHVLPIAMPPLRARTGDVMRIARRALVTCSAEEGKRFDGFEPRAEALLDAHPWPGNVRELLNVVRHAVVMSDGPLLGAAAVAAALSTTEPTLRDQPATPPSPVAVLRPLRQQEHDIIASAVAACGGNIARAAAALEISPSTIYRKLQRWPAAETAA